MPDGTKRKLLNLEAIHGLGWKSKIPLESGLRKTYEWYQKQSFSKQENLNLHNILKGSYIIQIRNKDGRSFYKKIINQ